MYLLQNEKKKKNAGPYIKWTLIIKYFFTTNKLISYLTSNKLIAVCLIVDDFIAESIDDVWSLIIPNALIRNDVPIKPIDNVFCLIVAVTLIAANDSLDDP